MCVWLSQVPGNKYWVAVKGTLLLLWLISLPKPQEMLGQWKVLWVHPHPSIHQFFSNFSLLYFKYLLSAYFWLLTMVKVFMLNLIIKFLDKPNINICLQVIKILADNWILEFFDKNKEQIDGSLWTIWWIIMNK